MRFAEDAYMDALDAELDEIIANAQKAAPSKQPEIAKQVMKDAGKEVPKEAAALQYKNGALTSSGKILKAMADVQTPRYVAQIRKDAGISLTAFTRSMVYLMASGYVKVNNEPGKMAKYVITPLGLEAAETINTQDVSPKSGKISPLKAFLKNQGWASVEAGMRTGGSRPCRVSEWGGLPIVTACAEVVGEIILGHPELAAGLKVTPFDTGYSGFNFRSPNIPHIILSPGAVGLEDHSVARMDWNKLPYDGLRHNSHGFGDVSFSGLEIPKIKEFLRKAFYGTIYPKVKHG